MELSLFLSLFGFLWVAAITPGPNNMLLTTSGANFGFMSTIPLMLGIMFGMQIMLLLIAFGVGNLIILYPALHLLLKIAGSAYLLWLAWKITTAAYESLEVDNHQEKSLPLWQGALLQLVNPKAWLMSLGAVASFSLEGQAYITSIAYISLAMFLVNLLAGCVWLAFGTVIGRWLHSPRAWRQFNLFMGLLTAVSVGLIWI
ncbi:LysE family translocator [Rosenbergiella australiborealis]|uniref:LysE family translocator n=1 Tax=Rosenbergiella australiborealis TaxID=1544696 RepID=A0ABS5T592_9GAMM|nr:LysE family translocator [Rosenbergiella australiborealis]MBT0727302.1 LysE family translocator [Rosenbergiella australiborealis]